MSTASQPEYGAVSTEAAITPKSRAYDPGAFIKEVSLDFSSPLTAQAHALTVFLRPKQKSGAAFRPTLAVGAVGLMRPCAVCFSRHFFAAMQSVQSQRGCSPR